MPEALEAICPVSSLILLSPLAIVPPPAESRPNFNLADPDYTPDDARNHARRSPSFPLSTTDDPAINDVAAIPNARANAPLEHAAEVTETRLEVRASLSINDLGGSSLIVSATFPTFSIASMAAAQPMTGTGNASIPAPSSGVASVPTSGHASAPAPADADGIRPMALAPTLMPSAEGSMTLMSGDGDTGSGGGDTGSGGRDTGSGGCDNGNCGDPGDIPPPRISGGTSVDGEAPNYTIGSLDENAEGGVPVGAVVSFTVADPDHGSYQIDTTQIQWEGGSLYSSYLSKSAGSEAPTAMSVKMEVNDTSPTYTFIVDPEEREYTVKVQVQYVGGIEAPATTVKFKSVRPEVVLTANQSSPQFFPDPVPPPDQINSIGISLGNRTTGPPGMVITAETSVGSFSGSFMFLQVVQTRRYTIDANGGRWWMPVYPTNSSDAWAIDNSYPGENKAIGYPIREDPQHEVGNNTWKFDADSSLTRSIVDTPWAGAYNTHSYLSIGYVRRDPDTQEVIEETPEVFDTYLKANV
ncbi:hypothetical protein BH23PLA1_BH23PLA1_20440 [soil metagenome]